MKKTLSSEVSEASCTPECSSCFSMTNVLLIIVIVLNALGLYLLTGNSLSVSSLSIDSFGIKRALLEVEYDKAGSRENYEILTRAQQLSLMDDQNPSNMKAMKQYVQSFGADGTKQPTGDSTAPSPDAAPLILTGDKLTQVISSASIQGNKDADILVIEYSDTECPFCVKQYQETKLWPSLQAKYADKVKFAFKNNRGVNHPGTEAKAIGALCAKKVGGDSAYVKFYTTVMDGTTQAAGVYDVAKLPDAAKASGVDLAKWQACFDAKETLTTFTEETNEANGFGLGGTPGTLILNVKTGKYATIEGAYPFNSFTQKIDELMK